MSTIRRQTSYVLLVGLCCWLLLASGAPIDETESNDLDSAIEDIERAKISWRKKSSKGSPSLVRYRHPIQYKKAFVGEDHEEEEEEDDLVEMLVNRLAGQEESIDLNDLAKEVALELLLEGNQNGPQQQHHPSIMKKKKKKKGGSIFENEKKKKKRMNFLMEHLMGNKGDIDNENEEKGDDDEEEPVQDLIRELINQGLSEEEIETLVSALAEKEATDGMGEEEEEDDDKRKKKRSPEWRKLPRGAHRWRYLHSESSETPRNHDNGESDDAEHHQDPLLSRPTYVGRGFHRVGSGGQDDPISRSVSQLVSTKRIQHPLMTKNAVSAISKRSAATAPEENIKEEIAQQSDDSGHTRKRRSTVKENEKNNKTAVNVSSDQDDSKSAEDPQPSDNKQVQIEEHKVVIRKKSVDWDDYFGFDKRSSGQHESDYAAAAKQYYKNVADSLAYRRKRNGALARAGEHDAEEALEAAFIAMEERHRKRDLERIRSDMFSELVDNLSPEDLDQMTNQLAEELLHEMKEDDDYEIMDNKKRSSIKKKRPVSFHNKRGEWRKKKDQRRKRNSSVKQHAITRRPEGEEDCAVAEQVVSTCNMVSNLYGGYRAVLGNACFRHQACTICSDEEPICDAEYEQHVVTVCGSDLLCQSQSRRLLSALGQLDQMAAEYFQGNQQQIQALCRADSCLAAFWKRR